MKIIISKNKNGNGYYTKIQNDYNGKHTEKYLTIQIPKGTELTYGLYDVDGFLSCYETKDGNTELKLIATDITQLKEYTESDPFKKFGDSIKTESKIDEQIKIKESDLPF